MPEPNTPDQNQRRAGQPKDAATDVPPKASTRERILDIALELFVDQGYEKTSLRDIAERLGTTKAALYYHFENKDQLHLEIHLRLITSILEQLDEIAESEATYPERIRRVVELTLRLAEEMLELAGIDDCDPRQTLRDGTAMDRFRALIAAQGGDLSVPLPVGKYSETVTAARSGTMGGIDAMAVGLAVWRLGAGRSRPGEKVQPGAGILIHRRPGKPVAAGESLFTLYTDTPQRFAAAMAELAKGFTVTDTPPVERPLIIDRIT